MENGQNWPQGKGYNYALQNGLFGSKIKIAKTAKNVSREALELFCAKKGRQKIPNIREMRSFRKFSKLALMIFMLLTKRKIYRPG